MENKYFVVRVLHNGAKDTYDVQKPSMFDDFDSAKKELHNIMSTYIQYGDLDSVCVILFDGNGAPKMSDSWKKSKTE